jgi:hypothetical protein
MAEPACGFVTETRSRGDAALVRRSQEIKVGIKAAADRSLSVRLPQSDPLFFANGRIDPRFCPLDSPMPYTSDPVFGSTLSDDGISIGGIVRVHVIKLARSKPALSPHPWRRGHGSQVNRCINKRIAKQKLFGHRIKHYGFRPSPCECDNADAGESIVWKVNVRHKCKEMRACGSNRGEEWVPLLPPRGRDDGCEPTQNIEAIRQASRFALDGVQESGVGKWNSFRRRSRVSRHYVVGSFSRQLSSAR